MVLPCAWGCRARLSEQQVEELLVRIVQLFTFISDKVCDGCALS